MRVLVVGRSRSGTTILRDILSSHKDVWITNELRTYNIVEDKKDTPYHCVSVKDSAEEYFRFVGNKIQNNYHKLYKKFDKNIFQQECMKNLKGNTLINKLEALETVLFENRFKIFGDKTGIAYDIFETLIKNNINFKVIHIYRDGRDVAFSYAEQCRV